MSNAVLAETDEGGKPPSIPRRLRRHRRMKWSNFDMIEIDRAINAAIDEAMADPGLAHELIAKRYPLTVRRLMVEKTIAGADEQVPNVLGRAELVDRVRSILLHPAAGRHWPEARALVFDNDLSLADAIRALDAIAANPSSVETMN